MSNLTAEDEEHLYSRIEGLISAARGRVARTVNSTMVHAYWLIGREIVEHEQQGEDRADYGKQLILRLAKRLSSTFGKGFGRSNLWRMRQFYLAFPQGSALVPESEQKLAAPRRESLSSGEMSANSGFPPELSWTHYRILLTVADNTARRFYEIEAAQENWSSRELERQIGSMLFERLSLSRDQASVRQLGAVGQVVTRPEDVIKDPVVLEFLGLQQKARWLESDLEQAIMDRLQDFLLELGKGFCFVARQKRLTLDGDHFYVDLVFYNRLLRCFVLVDLKLGKLTHQDLGQMQMYVNYYDRYQRTEDEAPTIGILLCSQKNDAMVRITLPHNSQIRATRYQIYLPTAEQLRHEVLDERQRLEQAVEFAEE